MPTLTCRSNNIVNESNIVTFFFPFERIEGDSLSRLIVIKIYD